MVPGSMAEVREEGEALLATIDWVLAPEIDFGAISEI